MTTNPIKVIQKLVDAQDRVADFIANGPAGGLQGAIRDGYRTRCNQFANLPAWARALGNGPTGTLNRLCQPYWDDNGWDGPVQSVPFTGGQCAGVSYSFWGEQWNPITSSWGAAARLGGAGQVLNGPITSISINRGAACSNGFGNSFQAVLTATGGASGTSTLSFNVACLTAPGSAQTGLRNVNARRADGGTDTCGNPPAELQPGTNPPPNPGPIDAPDPTADPNDPTGAPLLPLPDYDDPLDGPTPIEAPADPVPPGAPESGPGSSDNVGDAIEVTPAGDEGEETEFPEPPEGKSWIGCLLNFDIPESFGGIAGSGPQNKVLPRVFGNASLVFDGGRGIAYRQTSAWSYVVRPTGALKVTGVYVNCDSEITYTVRPIAIENCPENLCS